MENLLMRTDFAAAKGVPSEAVDAGDIRSIGAAKVLKRIFNITHI